MKIKGIVLKNSMKIKGLVMKIKGLVFIDQRFGIHILVPAYTEAKPPEMSTCDCTNNGVVLYR